MTGTGGDRDRAGQRMTRREALATLGLAAAATGLGGMTRGAFAADEASDYGPFRAGIQSFSLRGFDLHEALHKTKELGLHFWESFPKHIPPDVAKADEYRSEAKHHGVTVVGYGVIAFTKDHDANRKSFEFGKAMGLEYLSAAPSADSFDSLDKLVEEYDIAVGIHNHGPGDPFAKIDTIAEAIKNHHEKIGCCIDTGHFLRSKEDPVRAAETFGKRIYGVHLKDVKNTDTFTILGQGDLRLVDFLKTLKRLGYKHNLALEYEEHESDPMSDLRECLVALKKAVAAV